MYKRQAQATSTANESQWSAPRPSVLYLPALDVSGGGIYEHAAENNKFNYVAKTALGVHRLSQTTLLTLAVQGTREGQRWVIRGVAREFGAQESLEAWHETCPVCLFEGLPDDSLAEAVAAEGVMLVPLLRAEHLVELDRLARQTTIAVCVLESSPDWPADLRRRIPQTIFWQSMTIDAPRELAPWAQGALVSLGDDPTRIAEWQDFPAPVVVRRKIASVPSLAAARAECDRLQRDVAPHGDWAGFIISTATPTASQPAASARD